MSAAMPKLEVAVDHFVKTHSLTKVRIARLKGDAKEEASQKSCWGNEMASAISNRDSANAEIKADTAKISKLNAEHKDLMKDIAKNR